jgi:hypothetical protein
MKIIGCAPLAAALLALPAHAQGITEQDVTSAMEAPEVRDGLEGCIGPSGRPVLVQLTIAVDAAGGATLKSTSPLLDGPTHACLAGAVAGASFPATGGEFEIVYPVAFEAAAAEAQPQPVVAAGPEAAPTPAGDWEATYRQGRALFVSGIVLTAGGFLVAGVSGFFILITWFMGDAGAVLPTAAWVALGGAAVIAVGIPLLVVGILKKRRASRMKAGLAIETVLHEDLVSGGSIPALSLRF